MPRVELNRGKTLKTSGGHASLHQAVPPSAMLKRNPLRMPAAFFLVNVSGGVVHPLSARGVAIINDEHLLF